jgi:hypothetical protein
MKSMNLIFAMSVAVLVCPQPGGALDRDAPYGGRGATLSLLEISPNRSLPIAYNPSDYVRYLHEDQNLEVDNRFSMSAKTRVFEGWKVIGAPEDLAFSTAEVRIKIVTNNVETVRRDVQGIFAALGCVPMFQLGEVDAVQFLGVAVFDDLVFIHGERLGFVILTRIHGSQGEYRFSRQSAATRPPSGEVREVDLWSSKAFVFMENRAIENAREWRPVRPRIMVFDGHGRPVLGDGNLITRADEVDVRQGALFLRQNTVALIGPPLNGYSAVVCPHGEAQYSLLNPVTKNPVGVQSTIRIAYKNGLLAPTALEIGVVSVDELQGRAQACRWFPDLSDIRDYHCFGTHEWDKIRNLQACAGSVEGYLLESWEASRSYFYSLKRRLKDCQLEQVVVDPGLLSIIDSLSDPQTGAASPIEPPTDLGDDIAFGFLRSSQQ